MCDCTRGCVTEEVTVTQQEADYKVTLVVEPVNVEIVSCGTQGPEGPPGPSGVAFLHEQTLANDTWIVNHNLGRVTGVELYTTLGQLVLADVSIETTNFDTTTITFASPQAGYAVLT